MQELNACQNTWMCISFCASMRKYIRRSFFAGHCPVREEEGGGGGISSCTYNGGNIFYNILNIECRQRISHYKNHYKTKRSHRLRWSKYACVLSNCLSRFFAYFCWRISHSFIYPIVWGWWQIHSEKWLDSSSVTNFMYNSCIVWSFLTWSLVDMRICSFVKFFTFL